MDNWMLIHNALLRVDAKNDYKLEVGDYALKLFSDRKVFEDLANVSYYLVKCKAAQHKFNP